jgi:EmrB/QacA subfamily drug resistance transporter
VTSSDSPRPDAPNSPTTGLLALGAVVAAVFLGALDQTVIVTVLPAIVTDLQIPFNKIDQAAWIVSGYLLGYTVALPLVGRFADLRGRRISLVFALVAFGVGSAGCAVAPSLVWLIAARLVQAAGGGALLPVAIGVVADRYPPARRALAIGLVGAVAEAGGVLGPLYGAAIVSWLGWRWIFWLNLPLAVGLLVAAWRGLSDLRQGTGRLDLRGATLTAGTLACLILGLAHEPIVVFFLDLRLPLGILSAILLLGFIWTELRVSDPLFDLGLFRRPAFAAAIGGGVLLGGGLIVAMVDVPLVAATVFGATPADGGLLLMRLTVLIPFGALVGGFLGQRFGLGLPTGVGFLVAAAGLSEMSRWGVTPDQGPLWLSLGLAGFGFGLLIAPLSTAAVNFGGGGQEAASAAWFTVARLTGMAIGLSALTTWGLQRFDDLAGVIPLPIAPAGASAADAQKQLDAYSQALVQVGAEVYHEIFLVGAAICLIGLVVPFWLQRRAAENDSRSLN